MSNLDYSIEYKNKIINLLLKNEDLIKLINPDLSKCDKLDVVDVLLGGTWLIDGEKYDEQGHIFDYDFVDETIQDEKTFIFVETDIEFVRETIFTDFNLYICVFSYKDLIKITNDTLPTVSEVKDMGFNVSSFANRIDVMCSIIDGIMSTNSKMPGIGTVTPASRGFCTIYRPNVKYYGKCLKYQISNLYERGEECGDN